MEFEFITSSGGIGASTRGAVTYCYVCSVKKQKLVKIEFQEVSKDGESMVYLFQHHGQEYKKDYEEFNSGNRIRTDKGLSFLAFYD